ncbi:hypothetical protein [Planctomyces sp. SH-PL14]|uniref:hypothetical protein n=1 Tax=Planctomyces sp. SH-PL14 TaxID=1632864 RepID=UPI00078C6219|nr:hypothetical protein [Planctomyces sp. SH-PL14]AMV21847.1 hypothetical protein VT03_28355 [Planctomyces sp. SH-PL14]
MGKKQPASPGKILATELLAALRQNKESGSNPAPFRQMAEAARPGVSESELREAIQLAPLKNQLILAFDQDLDSLAVLKEDAARLAGDDRLLQVLLQRLCSQNFPLVTIEQCRALLPKSLQTAFGKAWTERMKADRLPGFVRKVSTGPKKTAALLDVRFHAPWETLSRDLVQALRRLREQGSYPVLFSKVQEQTNSPDNPADLVKQARDSEPCRSQLTVLRAGPDDLVCLTEDRARLLGGDLLFEQLLQESTSPAVPTITLKKLSGRLAKNDQTLFLELWGERLAKAELPPFLRLKPGKIAAKPELRELHFTRYPLPSETAAQALLDGLRRRRQQENGYPISIDELLNEALPDAPASLRKQAAESDLYRKAVQEIGAGSDRSAFLIEDTAQVAPRLIAPTLAGLVTAQDQAIPLDKLSRAKAIPSALREAFVAALHKAVETGTLPTGLGTLQIAKKWMLFRLSDVRREEAPAVLDSKTPASSEPSPPASATPRESLGSSPSSSAGGSFAGDFERAFGEIDNETGRRNFVKLLDLRTALSQYGRSEFDEGVRRLRVERKFTLETSEGLHGAASDEERQAAIVEAGSRYLYCSRIR